MRTRTEIYREKAESCRRAAESTASPALRDRLVKLAEQWSAMADEAERGLRKKVSGRGQGCEGSRFHQRLQHGA